MARVGRIARYKFTFSLFIVRLPRRRGTLNCKDSKKRSGVPPIHDKQWNLEAVAASTGPFHDIGCIAGPPILRSHVSRNRMHAQSSGLAKT